MSSLPLMAIASPIPLVVSCTACLEHMLKDGRPRCKLAIYPSGTSQLPYCTGGLEHKHMLKDVSSIMLSVQSKLLTARQCIIRFTSSWACTGHKERSVKVPAFVECPVIAVFGNKE